MNPNREKLFYIIRRVARIWSAVIIGLGILMFIGEIIESFTTELDPYPIYENLIPLTLFTGVLGLALAWRWEGLGSGITIVSLIVNLGVYLITGRDAVGVVILILLPIFIPGLLFLVCGLGEKRMRELRA
jgi:hypothetical protein